MPRLPRSKLLPKDKPIRLLCISTCVRQQALCGDHLPPVDGKYDRRAYVMAQVSFYASLFAVELYANAVLADALLTYIHHRPDWAKNWSNEEVLRRACVAFPNLVADYCQQHRIEFQPDQDPPRELLQHKGFLRKMRKRLTSLPLFFQLIKQKTAFAFNRLDQVRGHFWAERYESIPVTDMEVSVLICLLAETQPVAIQMVPAVEDPHASSGWWRLLKEMREGAVEIDRQTVANVRELSAKVREFFGRDVLRLPAPQEGTQSGSDSANGSNAEQAEARETLSASADGQAASTVSASQSDGTTPQAASAQAASEAEELGQLVDGPVRMMVLGPVDTRQYPEQVTEGDAWQEARGVGPITERELAELVRWVGATWCAWRLIKPEDQREKFDRKLYERWREGQLPLLRMEELDERQRQRALERLSEWFWKWYEVCGVPSLATQADRQSWIGQLMAARNNPEELAEVMAKLMEISIARRYELRSALARVRLSISRVISAGELLQVDLVRGARELLNLRAWVARRRAMMVAEAPESGAAQASSPGDTG